MRRPIVLRQHYMAQAVAAALFYSATMSLAYAQDAANTEQKSEQNAQAVTVTGIRASLQKSIDTKKSAETNIEVVTAEDIGKMPDKNIADALSRLTGVSVQAGSANAMDEAERVAIRGTSPNLNLFTVGGHAISSGDWHVSDQGSSGRSVGFGLLPSQLIGQAKVYKTSQANITEGGIAGSIDMSLRRPLDFNKPLTAEAALGMAYADLPRKSDPQLSGLLAWQNENRRFGILLQAFKEKRHLRRDGQETFNSGRVTAAQATTAGDAALTNLRYPNNINAALFTGIRDREGAYLGLQAKFSPSTEVNFSGFQSTLKAENLNSSAYATINNLMVNAYVISNPTVSGDVLTGATLTRGATTPSNVVALNFDNMNRQGSQSDSRFYDLDLNHRFSSTFKFSGRIGHTKGSGETPSQPWITMGLMSPAKMTYQLHSDGAADYRFYDASGKPLNMGDVNNYKLINEAPAKLVSTDEEKYLHLDASWDLNWGPIQAFKFGAREAKHDREYAVYSPRWNSQDDPNAAASGYTRTSLPGGFLAITLPNGGTVPTPALLYPSDYAQGLGGDFDRNYFRFSSEQLQAFATQYLNWNTSTNQVRTSGYSVTEKNRAWYGMLEFEQGNWSGNVGVRSVSTKVSSLSYSVISTCAALATCTVPGAIVGSKFGTYLPQLVETDHTKLLPSLNVRWEMSKGVIARFAASRSLGRPNYNELAGAVALNTTTKTGSSGNPALKPITSDNLDLSLAWYYAPRAYVYGAVFKQDMRDYVKTGSAVLNFYNPSSGAIEAFTVNTRVGVKARIKGMELAVEQPIGAGFGVGANYTYVDSKDEDGIQLLSTSKHTANLIGFYENDSFSARLAWNRRSDYPYVLLGRGTTVPGIRWFDAVSTVSASISYRINDKMSLSLDGNNLNNPLRKGYHDTENLPANWYKAGRQYFLNLRMKY